MCLKSRSVISPVSLSQSLSHSPLSWPSPPSFPPFFPLPLQRASFQSSPPKTIHSKRIPAARKAKIGPSFNHNPKKDVPTLTFSQATSFQKKKTIQSDPHIHLYSPHPQGTGKGLFGKVAFGVNGHYCNLLPVDQFWRPNFTLRGFHQRCTKILSKGPADRTRIPMSTHFSTIHLLSCGLMIQHVFCMHCMSMIVNSYYNNYM